MAQFELNSWGFYEIDFYNYSTQQERDTFFVKFGMYDLKCFFKDGNEWTERISGMTFNIKNSSYYPEMKKYLDDRLRIYLRIQKLKKINENYGSK
jgi:hypothetical protein